MKVSFPSNGRTEKWVALDLVDKQGQATANTLNPRHTTHHSREKEKEKDKCFIYLYYMFAFFFVSFLIRQKRQAGNEVSKRFLYILYAL